MELLNSEDVLCGCRGIEISVLSNKSKVTSNITDYFCCCMISKVITLSFLSTGRVINYIFSNNLPNMDSSSNPA